MAPMAEIYPLQIVVASLAGWMNRRQGEVLEYLIEENRVLKEQLKGTGPSSRHHIVPQVRPRARAATRP